MTDIKRIANEMRTYAGDVAATHRLANQLDALAGVGPVPVEFCRALNDVAQKAMDYARNTDFGGEDDERLAALRTSKDEALHLYVAAYTSPQPALASQQAVATFVQSPYGNYPELKWRAGYTARIGDCVYTSPQPARITREALTRALHAWVSDEEDSGTDTFARSLGLEIVE